jgi:hypothetical protein
LKDYPDTKLLGVELKQYKKDMSDKAFAKRIKLLSLREIKAFINTDPKQLWKYYDDHTNTYYASDEFMGIMSYEFRLSKK